MVPDQSLKLFNDALKSVKADLKLSFRLYNKGHWSGH